MKQRLSLTIAIIVVTAVFALNAEAQTSGSQRMRANIPFAFSVGEKTLPAGVYTLSVVNPSSDRQALQIRSQNGRFSAIVQTSAVSAHQINATKLVFRRYGDHYFFAQIEVAGDATALVASRSRSERAARRALARGSQSTIVTVTAE